jgi:hypothetical protein
MKKNLTTALEVHGTSVAVLSTEDGDYISLTDMLRAKDGEFFISDWLRNRNTVEFLGIWESVFNPGFNCGEFAIIKSQAGLHSYKIASRNGSRKPKPSASKPQRDDMVAPLRTPTSLSSSACGSALSLRFI